jgi:hypothetical protein
MNGIAESVSEDETRYQLSVGDVRIAVESRGVVPSFVEGREAWGYRIVVTINGDAVDTYEGEGRGSVADFEGGKDERDALPSMAWMTLGELESAANDPDEFWNMATGYGEMSLAEMGGREKVEQILEALNFAERYARVLTSDEVRGALERRRDTVGDC